MVVVLMDHVNDLYLNDQHSLVEFHEIKSVGQWWVMLVDNIVEVAQMFHYHNLNKVDEQMYYWQILMVDNDRFLGMDNYDNRLIYDHKFHWLQQLVLIVLYLREEKM